METKICKICGIKKTIDNFNKCSGRNCTRTECKMCQSKINKQYRKNNKDTLNEKHKEYVKNNKEKYKEYSRKCYEKHKQKRNKQSKEYREQNKNKIKEYNKKYYKNNKEKITQNVKKYRDSNKQQLIKKQEEYNNKRRKEDSIFKLKCNIRNMINRSFTRKEYKKNKHTEDIIGCSIACFINHLLETFKNNYGYEYDGIEEVHIDHIMPLATAHTEEEVVKLCNYTNLQLLKAKDNLKKSSKTIYKIEGV